MSCRADDYNEGFQMEIWSGSERRNSQPQLECTVDATSSPTHVVEIKNFRTYDRTVYIQGIVQTHHNRARFHGPSFIVQDDRH
jgi:hypothetical protein